MCRRSNIKTEILTNNIIIIGEHMKIKTLKIRNIAGIKSLDLSFNDSFNAICGINGIGKTTILNIIADNFSRARNSLTKNSESDKGEYYITYNVDGDLKESTHIINRFIPDALNPPDYDSINSKYLLRFDATRNIDYKKLESLSPDPIRESFENSEMASSGIPSSDLKNWFVNRFAFHDKKESLSKEEIDNYNLSKTIFGILDDTVKFKTVLGKSYDIILSTNRGDIYFEYLSSGYKSCIYIIMGIIKEIEYRNTENPISVQNFDGCVLIDEIEEHLHPTWQAFN